MNYFSKQSDQYAEHRPRYPKGIFQYLVGLCGEREHAWDCGCGNGQASLQLSKYFSNVIATDVSESQIENALSMPNVTFRCEPSESTSITGGSVNLVVVAQALHWFDFEQFFEEVHRVCKPNGLFSAVTYNLCRVNDAVDQVIDDLYWDTLQGYWPDRRKYVDSAYSDIDFPFEMLPVKVFDMRLDWPVQQFIAYLKTWSGVKAYEEKNRVNPIDEIEHQIIDAWSADNVISVNWPVTVVAGRMNMEDV
jgi:SAM-dependent methyltransferase